MKKLRIVLIVFAVVAVLWSGMLITDITRSNDFQKPVFAKEIRVEADDGAIVYQGLGYTVCQREYVDESGNVYPELSEVRLFGMLVSAVIV